MQILVALSFGEPEHGAFEANDFLFAPVPQLPVRSQRLTGNVLSIGTTKFDRQRGRRSNGGTDGCTKTGKFRQNDGHGRASPLTVILQHTAL